MTPGEGTVSFSEVDSAERYSTLFLYNPFTIRYSDRGEMLWTLPNAKSAKIATLARFAVFLLNREAMENCGMDAVRHKMDLTRSV